MDERTKKVLERTREKFVRHLEDLNDMVEHDGGRIKDCTTRKGMKDCVSAICKIDGRMKETSAVAR